MCFCVSPAATLISDAFGRNQYAKSDTATSYPSFPANSFAYLPYLIRTRPFCSLFSLPFYNCYIFLFSHHLFLFPKTFSILSGHISLHCHLLPIKRSLFSSPTYCLPANGPHFPPPTPHAPAPLHPQSPGSVAVSTTFYLVI